MLASSQDAIAHAASFDATAIRPFPRASRARSHRPPAAEKTTRYYNTASYLVREAMIETGIDHHDLVHALLERDHTVEDIKTMSPRKRLQEYLHWNFYMDRADTILAVADAAGLTGEGAN
jgi:hypothetical protein